MSGSTLSELLVGFLRGPEVYLGALAILALCAVCALAGYLEGLSAGLRPGSRCPHGVPHRWACDECDRAERG